MFLGIAQHKNTVYEGTSIDGMRAVFPPPHLFNMQVGESPKEALNNLINTRDNIFKTLLFREDDFDFLSMVRRGRVYSASGTQPRSGQHYPIDAFEAKEIKGSDYGVSKDLFTYQSQVLSNNQSQALRYAAIGADDAFSLWRIVSIDQTYTKDELITLRPLHSMGALPDLDLNKVTERWRKKLTSNVEKVVNAIKRENADSIIELCRHAATTALLAYFDETIKDYNKEDLGPLTKRAAEAKKRIVSHCGKIINDLHSRVKPNIQEEYSLRLVTERDAELAIQCLSCILSDLDYTKE